MNELLDTLVGQLPVSAKELLPLILVGVAVAWVVIYVGLTTVIRLSQRWKEADGFRRPFHILPRYLFVAKGKILASKEVREFYEPAAEHTRELKKSKRSRTQRLDARKQISELSDWIRVRPLPHFVLVAGYKEHEDRHFMVELSYTGKSRDAVEKLGEFVLTQLKAHSVDKIETKSQVSISFVVHMDEPEDILTEQMVTSEFFEQNPATKWSEFPVAIDEHGNPVKMPITHTLMFGMTGSGKGSPFNAFIRQAIPFVLKGEAKLFGLDPKESEVLPYEFTSLFEKTVYSVEDSMVVISDLYELQVQRKGAKRKLMNFKKGQAEMMRRIPASKENPMILIMIDELLSLILDLEQQGAAGKKVQAKLVMILAQGRGLGIYAFAATQQADMALLGRLRGNFVSTITMRNQESEHINEVMLGQGAIDRGFDPRKIKQSTEANNYATSGIGYVKGETGDPKLVRFAYTSDEDLAALVRAYPKDGFVVDSEDGNDQQEVEYAPTKDDGVFAITDMDDEQLPELEPFVLDEFEEDEPLPRMI
jgi:hypothetical protein